MAKFSQNFMNVLAQAPERQQQRDVSGMMSQQAAPMSRMQSGLSRALGMDTRTYGQQASDDMKKIADPNSNEGILKALEIQMQYEQDPQKKLLFAAKAAEIKRNMAAQSAQRKRYVDMAKLMRERGRDGLATLLEEGGDEEVYKAAIGALEGGKETKKKPASIIKDGNGDLFRQVMDEKGNISYTSFNTGKEGSPQGEIAIVNTSGVTAGEEEAIRAASQMSIDSNKQWLELKGQSREGLRVVQSGITQLSRMRDLVNQMDSQGGGVTAEILSSAKQFFGIEAANEAELRTKLQLNMLRTLNDTIKGNPTAVEMVEVKKALASLRNNKSSNLAIIDSALGSLQSSKDVFAKALDPESTLEEYNSFLFRRATGVDEPQQGLSPNAAQYL